MDAIFGKRHLPGKVIAALVPRKRSGTTRAALADKTINALIRPARGFS